MLKKMTRIDDKKLVIKMYCAKQFIGYLLDVKLFPRTVLQTDNLEEAKTYKSERQALRDIGKALKVSRGYLQCEIGYQLNDNNT